MKSLGHEPFKGLRVDPQLAKRGSLLDRAELLDELCEIDGEDMSREGGSTPGGVGGESGGVRGPAGSGEDRKEEDDKDKLGGLYDWPHKPLSFKGNKDQASGESGGGIELLASPERLRPVSASLGSPRALGSPRNMHKRKSAIIARINADEGSGAEKVSNKEITAKEKREKFLRHASLSHRQATEFGEGSLGLGGGGGGLMGHAGATALSSAAAATAAQAVAAGVSGDLKAHGAALSALASQLIAQEGG